jgi:carbamoylphosphate synthase large subunit
MNSNIKDKVLTTGKEEGKKHQAYAMELSRLKTAKEICLNTKNCVEYNTLGGDARFNEIETVVEVPKKADEFRRKTQKDTNPNNMYQDEKSPTDINIPSVSRKSNHDGGEKHKILNNSQALSEGITKEISEIRYLIEYMNNNKKQNL